MIRNGKIISLVIRKELWKGRWGIGRNKQLFYKSMTQNLPLVSIVTIVYNGEKYVEQTIKSVLQQSYYNIEYIIIDGGSTDKTVSIINKYRNRLAYWISEKDNGI